MGMFDHVVIKYPLPWPDRQGKLFQTKSLLQRMERYEIREDGTLWRQVADEVWVDTPDDECFGGYMASTNERWLQVTDAHGEVECNSYTNQHPSRDWCSVRFWFRDGLVKDAIFERNTLGESRRQNPAADAGSC